MTHFPGSHEVDWARLQAERQRPFDIPALLARALEHDPGEALGHLRRAVFGSRRLWAVTSPAVPFLVRLASISTNPQLSRGVVELLHDVALGRGRGAFPLLVNVERLLADAAAVEAGTSRGPDGENPRIAIFKRDTFFAVELSLESLLPLLEAVNDALVSAVIALVAEFPAAAPTTTPALWRLVHEEDDGPLGGQALVALAQLGAEGVAFASRVTADAQRGTTAGFFASAADCLASPEPDPTSVHELLSLPRARAGEPCPFTSSVGTLQMRVVRRLPRSAHARVIRALGTGQMAFQADQTARLLLELSRISGPPRDELQREALSGLLALEWSPTVLTLLREYDLPTSRDELGQLMKASPG